MFSIDKSSFCKGFWAANGAAAGLVVIMAIGSAAEIVENWAKRFYDSSPMESNCKSVETQTVDGDEVHEIFMENEAAAESLQITDE